MIEFEEKLCTLSEERLRHCDLTGKVIQVIPDELPIEVSDDNYE